MAASSAQALIYRLLAQRLQELGLGSLIQVDAAGNPKGWLWDRIVEHGSLDPSQLELLIESTPEFKARFPVIADQRRRAAAGEPVIVMKAADIRAYEQQVASLMRYAQMPTTMGDDWHYAQELLSKGISVNELSNAITTSYARVVQAPKAVQDAFARLYGARGGATLAAYFLDPDHINANLDVVSRAASVAGYAQMNGMTIDTDVAEKVARLGYEGGNFANQLAEVATSKGLYEESVSEGGEDLRAEREGVLAAAGADEAARVAIANRRQRRQAAFSDAGGGMLSERGLATGRASQGG